MNFSENKEKFFFPQARQVRPVLQHCLQSIKPCRFNTGQQTSSRVQKGQAAQWNHLSPPFTICKATGIQWLTSAVLLPGKYGYLGNNKSNQKSVKHILFFPEEKMADGTWQQSSSPSKPDKTEENCLFSTITMDSRSRKFQLQQPDLGEILREFLTLRELCNSMQGTRMETF